MAEPQHPPLLRSPSQTSAVETPNRGSTRHALKVAGLTLLAGMLIAGQAITAYMVYNQREKLSTLETRTEMLREVSRRPTVMRTPMRMHLPLNTVPLLADLPDSEKKDGSASVPTAKRTPMRMHLPLNTVPLLADLPDSEKKDGSASPPTVQTKCQREASGQDQTQLPSFKPQCDNQGNYLPKQCWSSTGFCWCVDKNGAQVTGTLTEGEPNCTETSSAPQQ
ncbi:CD74 molecule, major histocompatibility complex, class II invariant chain b [Chanos chanos]|uniref:CD74 molecule, major histocompatibility complex, class II invariant chain b n=1 Tax=Chanos chanos TaxID=29144 RepID=A0A6J2VZF1_CHACN|nr:HLA class II histocompatibility antigen gamma chain [Chanos chanos]